MSRDQDKTGCPWCYSTGDGGYPEANIYHHLRMQEQIDLVALYRALDEAREEVLI